MGAGGAIPAAGIALWASTRMADAADRRRDAVAAARRPAVADAAAGLSAGNHCAALLLRLAGRRRLADDQPLSVDGGPRGRRA